MERPGLSTEEEDAWMTLEHLGFIERFPCPEDRRATDARLLPAGQEKVDQAAPGYVA